MKHADQRLRKATVAALALTLLAGGAVPGGAFATTTHKNTSSHATAARKQTGRRVRRHHRRRVRRHHHRAVRKTRQGA